MGKYSNLQGVSASAGRVPFMERVDANYVVAHKESGIRTDRQGNDYWYVDFVVLAAEGDEGHAPVGAVRRQMFVYGTADLDFIQGARKAVLLAFEGLEEEDFNGMDAGAAAEMADVYFPFIPETEQACTSTAAETEIARLRTYKHESRKGNAITGHAWSAAGGEDSKLEVPTSAF
jgi:hypothetical protein